MKFNCHCGQGIDLKQKEAQKVLLDEVLFCSPECFKDYVLEYKPNKPKVDYILNRDYTSTPCDVYDKYKRKWFRSWYEVYVNRMLDKFGIENQYEKYTLHLNPKYYTPDFYIPEKDLFIEVKGLWEAGSRKKFIQARDLVNIVLFPAYLQKQFQKNYGMKEEVIR